MAFTLENELKNKIHTTKQTHDQQQKQNHHPKHHHHQQQNSIKYQHHTSQLNNHDDNNDSFYNLSMHPKKQSLTTNLSKKAIKQSTEFQKVIQEKTFEELFPKDQFEDCDSEILEEVANFAKLLQIDWNALFNQFY